MMGPIPWSILSSNFEFPIEETFGVLIQNIYICATFESSLVMKELDNYRISLKGLRPGINNFTFELGPTFFRLFEQQLIREAFVQVDLEVDRRSEMLVVNFSHQGYMITPCDRCLEAIKLPLRGKNRLLIKFEVVDSEEDAEVVFLKADSDFFNPARFIYEFVALSIPMVRTYDCTQDPEAPCNEEVLKHLKPQEEPKESPIWDELKKLKLN